MAGINNKVREVSSKTIFPDAKPVVDSTISFNQGELLYMNPLTGLMTKGLVEADAATFLGIAPITVVNGHVPNVYGTDVDASVAITAIPGPVYGSVFKLILKAGDVIIPGQVVYADPPSGHMNVSVTGTKVIGVYQGPALTAGPLELVDVLIGARYPTDALHL